MCHTEIESCRLISAEDLKLNSDGCDATSIAWTHALQRELQGTLFGCLRAICCHSGVLRGFVEFRVRLHTGRRHQIRSCFSHIGFPIVLDKQYETLRGFSVTHQDITESYIMHTREKAAQKGIRKIQLADLRRQLDEGSNVAVLLEHGMSKAIETESAERCKLLRLMDQAEGLTLPIGEKRRYVGLSPSCRFSGCEDVTASERAHIRDRRDSAVVGWGEVQLA